MLNSFWFYALIDSFFDKVCSSFTIWLADLIVTDNVLLAEVWFTQLKA